VDTLKLGLPPHLQHNVKVTWLLSVQELLAAEIQSAPHSDFMMCWQVLLPLLGQRKKIEPETDSHSRFCIYEGWNFNSGNYLFTTDTK